MTFAITNSGTHAGWKKPMGNATPWECGCPAACVKCERHGPESWCDLRTNAAYLVRCPDCGNRRP